ncbi:MAG TPA: TonB family protein [Myxococcales bacterium]|jgi:TonB family protein|nr:TonB family protein [Myxococcales bacterium]
MILALLIAAQLTKLPQLVDAPPAVYPPDRLARGETADVACMVDIDEHGSVTAVAVEKPGAPDFDAAAVDAIRRFRFTPAEMDGQPAAVRIRYVYHFVIQQQRAPAARQDTAKIHGEVVEAGNRRPVAGAEVVDDTGAQASADAHGKYALETVPGPRKLTISAPGFESRTVDATAVDDGDVAAPRAWLHRTSVGDLQATVPGEKPHDAPTRRTLTHDELVNVPGSLNDPIRAVQNLPGLARSPFLGGQLLVRGSPPQDTGTYLDGHRIPQLYHFLGGPSVINEQLLDRIDFYPGGYGAIYGRNLTGAIDVSTRKGDSQALHGQASLDMIEAVGALEGPVGSDTQFAVAARRSHIDVFLPLFIPNDPNQGVTSIVPIYWDYQARVDHKLGNGDDLGLLFFGSDDKLTVVQEGGRRTLPLSVNSHLAFHRIVGEYKHTFSDEVSLSISPALGWTLQNAATQGAGPGGFANPQSVDVTILTGELRAETRWRAASYVEWRGGADIELDRASYTADIQSSLQLRNLGIPITQRVQLARVQPVQQWGEYLEAQLTLGRLSLTPGLRLDQYHWRDHARWSVDPRLWARYGLSDRTALKAYVGLYHQPPSGQQIDNDIGNPDLGLSWAVQTGVGVEQRFSDVWSVSAEIFYNRRGGLISVVDPVLRSDGTIFNPRFQNVGIGHAYGLELLIRREITSKLYGWLAYTLSRSQALPRPDDAWRAFQFDQPHILTLVMGYRPKPQWDLSTRFRFVSGNPYAPVDFATFDADSGNFVPTRGEVGDAREPTFLQLDVRAQHTWTWDYWQLSLYLDVQNVTNHTNEEFHVYDYRFQDQGSVQGLPILPTFGVKGKF